MTNNNNFSSNLSNFIQSVATPEISVIIPMYNAQPYIADALKSIQEQTFNEYEIIVIDDGSTDKSAKIVKSFPRVNYYYQNNQGEAAARNQGMKLARGKIITFLDADDWYESTKLEEQWRFLQENPAIDVVYCNYIVKDHTKQDTTIIKSEYFDPNRKNLLATVLFRQTIHTGSMMFRRQCFETGCRYNPQLSYAPDYDFCLQLLANHQFGYIHRPLYGYRRHQGNMTNAHQRQKLTEAAIVRALGISKIRKIIDESSFDKSQKNLLLARIFLKTGKYRECLQQLEQRVRAQDILLASFYRGNCHYMLGVFSLSQQTYQKVIELCPAFPEAMNNLGCALSAQNRDIEARQAFTSALKLRPGYMDAAKNLKESQSNHLTLFELRNVLTHYY